MSELSLRNIWHQIIGMAEVCDRLASQHHHGTALLPPGMSATVCRDFATQVEHACKALSVATHIKHN
jgi:hypothetical protein